MGLISTGDPVFPCRVRGYSTKATAALRGQTDRNIRKVRNTLLKKIIKKILPVLKRREEKGLPLTREERALLAEMKKYGLTDRDRGGYNGNRVCSKG